MSWFPCPYLGGEVELTDEREHHVTERHPDLLPQYRDRLAEVLENPDQIRKSVRFGSAKLFSRWFSDLRDGRHIVVVVVSGPAPSTRNWIITAYITRNLAKGEIEWKRD